MGSDHLKSEPNPKLTWNDANDLKEEGNAFFKASKFDHADASYGEALDLIGFEFPYPEDLLPFFQSLAISLSLNIAACCINWGNLKMPFLCVRLCCVSLLRMSKVTSEEQSLLRTWDLLRRRIRTF